MSTIYPNTYPNIPETLKGYYKPLRNPLKQLKVTYKTILKPFKVKQS